MKPVFQALVALIGIAAVGALIISFGIDGIVKSNIQSTTSEMLETRVEVKDVSISILDGSGTIEGITIHNPKGFSDNPSVKLRQITMKMDLATLLSDTVVINKLHIKKPEVYFEQKVSGNNLAVLSDKLGSSSSSDINVVVDYLLVENGHVTLTTDIGKQKTVEGEFSKIEIEGIGRKGNNTIEQTLKQILEPILHKAIQEVAKQEVKGQVKEKIQDLIEG